MAQYPTSHICKIPWRIPNGIDPILCQIQAFQFSFEKFLSGFVKHPSKNTPQSQFKGVKDDKPQTEVQSKI
jgi:hypothetical protein